MLRLGYERGRVARLPIIRRLKEAGPRQGFLEAEQFNAVRRRLPEDLQVAVAISHAFGWRMRSEVLTLQRRQLDLEAGTLRLDAGTTKNEDGRVVYLTTELQLSWRPSVAAWTRSRSGSAESSRICSPTSPERGVQGSAGATSGRPGRRHARRPACPGCCATICGGRRCGTS